MRERERWEKESKRERGRERETFEGLGFKRESLSKRRGKRIGGGWLLKGEKERERLGLGCFSREKNYSKKIFLKKNKNYAFFLSLNKRS